MSYDLAFTVRPGSRAPTIAELKEWLAARPHWSVAEGGAGYANQATGASFYLYLRDNGPDDPPQRAPLDLTISGMGPHTLGLEAEEEVRALVERFGLLVDDPQLDGMGQGEFSGEKFLSGFEAYNRLAHRTAIQALDQRPAVLPAEKLEAAWRWNRVRDALAERSGDELFVPGVLFAEGREPGTVETFVAWVEGIEARVPEVDAIQGALGRVAWSEIAPALELAQREEKPLPHWLFQGEAVARVAEAIQRAPKAGRPPRLIPPREISTAELVAELLEPPGRDAAKEEAATQFQLAVSAHMRNDARAAFEAAVRAATGDPALQTACLLAAINGLYLARSAEALAWAERYLGPSPEDRTGHLLRGIALTDLARYDEAVEAIGRSLEGSYEAMNDNCRAYALAAGGRADEARDAYARALAAVDAALVEKPGDSELLARRSYSLAGLARFDEALAAAEQAIQADPGNFLALQDAARSAVELARFRETIDYAQRASALREIAPEAAYFAARAHAALGETEAARGALSRAAVTEHFRRMAAADPALAALLPPARAAKKPAAKAAKKPAAKATKKPAAKAAKRPAAKATKKPAAKAAKRPAAKATKKPAPKAAKATKKPAPKAAKATKKPAPKAAKATKKPAAHTKSKPSRGAKRR